MNLIKEFIESWLGITRLKFERERSCLDIPVGMSDELFWRGV